MKNKIFVFICLILVLVITSSVGVSAITYDCPAKISSDGAVVVNLERETIVYEKDAYEAFPACTMCELMDFIVVVSLIPDPTAVSIDITKDLIKDIPNTDGTLDQYIGKKLTIEDLLCIMMITRGNDAAYVLANHITPGDMDSFVDLMIDYAIAVGCTHSWFISPMPVYDKDQFVCPYDVYKMFKFLLKNETFCKAANLSYFSTQNDEVKKEEDAEIITDNSLKKPGSPYSFGYMYQSKFGYDEKSGQCLASVSNFYDNHYVHVFLKGKNEAEINTFSDTKQMVSWVYTKLSDEKLIASDTVIGSLSTNSVFSDDKIRLSVNEQVGAVLPKKYDKEDVTYVYDLPDIITLPIFEGQYVGRGAALFQEEPITYFDVVSKNSKGVELASDIFDVVGSMYKQIMPIQVNDDDLSSHKTTLATEEPTLVAPANAE